MLTLANSSGECISPTGCCAVAKRTHAHLLHTRALDDAVAGLHADRSAELLLYPTSTACCDVVARG